MRKSITWTVQFQENVFDDIYRILSGLEREDQQTKGSILSFLRARSAARRDNAIKILEDVDFIDTTKKGNTSFYKINSNGLKYLNAAYESTTKANRIFHSYLYRNVLHYSFTYDFILENEEYEFNKKDFIEKLVLNSSLDFGTRIFDWKSAEYVLEFMRSLDVISEYEKEKYSINKEYRKEFNDMKFIELIEDSLENESPQYTKGLCIFLSDRSEEFTASKELLTIENIYKKILNVNNIKKFLKFVPGLPRPPIPSKHTLVELREGS